MCAVAVAVIEQACAGVLFNVPVGGLPISADHSLKTLSLVRRRKEESSEESVESEAVVTSRPSFVVVVAPALCLALRVLLQITPAAE